MIRPVLPCDFRQELPMLGRILGKLRKSFRRRGVVGTVRYALDKLARPLLDLTPARRRERRMKEEKDRAFDSRYGLDTGGIVQLNQFRIEGGSWEYGTPYWAIDADEFVRLIGQLDIPHREYTFVDFGSGKGRAVLLASELPFKKVVGVELSADLDRAARENVRKFPADRQRCGEIDLVCSDVLEFPLPPGPGVYYFYNPFDREIMERVVARIEESLRGEPREIHILYANPQQGEVWDRSPCFRKVAGTGDYAIYTTGPGTPAAAAG